MARERIIESFILKRQDYGEADQITTLFSKEEGKVRVLVKAAKLPTSKLQPVLQPLFETRVSLAGNKDTGLSKVIGAQLIKAYSGILEDETKLAAWYVVSELLIRALPDSAPNEQLFSELKCYAEYLHETNCNSEQIKQSLVQFQIKALATLGLGVHSPGSSALVIESQNIWFSLDRGGFVTEDSVDAIPIHRQVFESFKNLADQPYKENEVLQNDISTLSGLINRFVTHQLEREIKSHQMLTNA